MSTTDGTSGRPGSGSPSSGGSGSGSGGSSTDTRPISAVRTEEGQKTARAVPAPGQGQAQGGQGQGGGGQVQQSTSQQPQKTAQKSAAPRPAGRGPAPTGRRVRLTVSRIDPWSAMKMSFLLSVALGIAMVVMVFVLWSVLAGMGIFDRVNDIAEQVFGADGSDPFDIMDYIGLGRVVSLSIVIGVIDVILITAIATLGAFLYNVSAALVGGIQLTLTDD
ncbi:MAG: DUF3566 domain-containing protein [Dermatophilaceae bacterium]